MFNMEGLRIYTFYLHTNFYILSSNGSLFNGFKPKVKRRLRAAPCFCLPVFKNTLTKLIYFSKHC